MGVGLQSIPETWGTGQIVLKNANNLLWIYWFSSDDRLKPDNPFFRVQMIVFAGIPV